MIGALRWVLGVTGPRLAPRLLPLWMAIGFVVSQFWTQIDWHAVRAGFARAPVLVGTVVTLTVAAGVASSVRQALRSSELAAIWRTPIGRWQRGALATGPAAAMMSPALAALILAPHGAQLAAVPIVLLPVIGWRGLPLVPLALASPLLALPASAASVWLAGDTILRWPVAADPRSATIMLRPPGPISALLWRDVLAIARSGRGHLTGALLPGLPLAGLLWGMRENGGQELSTRSQAVAVMFCLVAPLAGTVLGELRRALGRDLDSPRLPVGPGRRWAGLAAVAAAVMAPTGVALAAVDPFAVASPTAGLAWTSLVAGTVLVLAWARPGGRQPYSMGVQAAWCLGVLGLALWDSALARVLQLVLALLAGFAGRAGLARARRHMWEGRW